MATRTAARGRFIIYCLSIAAAILAAPSEAQIAAGKSKWLGNVTGNSVPSNFGTYWNQVTPENATKWGSVEGTRNQMNWAAADAAYNWAQQNGYPFKFHTFVWGSQFPNWLTNSGLTQAQQRAEIEQWMQLACQRYPNTFAIDVVNEPIKTPMPFAAALGGTGATGWDWVITSFQLARQYCPNAKLLINEYGTENDPPVRNTYKTIINLLKTRGLIDGIGIQAHYFNIDNMNRAAVTTMLNDYATLALDVYVSELDIVANNTEAGQLAKYQDVFPGFWEHSSVKGVTLWGYIVGQTWRDGTGIVNSNGTERSAMVWLKSYVAGSGGPRHAAADRTGGPDGAVHHQQFDFTGVERVDGQCRRGQLPDPARAGRQRRHIHAGGHVDYHLVHQYGTDGEHHLPLPGARGRCGGQCFGRVEHRHRGDPGRRRRYAAADRAGQSDARRPPPAVRSRWPGPHRRTTSASPATRSCARRAPAAARSRRLVRRRPRRSPIRASPPAPRSATRYAPWMRRAMCRRCRTR